MILRKAVLSTAIATSLVAAPVLAQPAAQPIERTASAVHGDHLFGFGAGWFIALLIIAAVVVIVVTNHKGTPVSP